MAVSPVPPGFHTVTPHLVIRGAAKAIDFYKKAFGATEIMRMPGPSGDSIGHAEIKIGDSIIFLADEWPGMALAAPAKFGGTTVSICLYVNNADATFNPASLLKLATSLTALRKLGANYRFQTSVFVEGEEGAKGAAQARLYVKGNDPTFGDAGANLLALAQARERSHGDPFGGRVADNDLGQTLLQGVNEGLD